MIILSGNDGFFASVIKALSEVDKNCLSLDGLVVCGSHSKNGHDASLEAIKEYREKKIPTLGICMGMQLMAIEYARNVLKLDGANSEELNPDAKHKVVSNMGEMRSTIFPVRGRMESFWHRYSIDRKYWKDFSIDWDMTIGNQVDEMRLKEHPFMVGVQYHPEHTSYLGNPHPIILEFINSCKRPTADTLHH